MIGQGTIRPHARIAAAATLALIAVVIVLALQFHHLRATMTVRATGHPVDSGPPWAGHIGALDAALAHGNISAAEWAWYRAHGEALSSRGWEGMLAVGQAALRIGAGAGGPQAAAAKARPLYLAALFRARSQRSVEGVFQVGEAFAALGDQEVVAQCLAVADRLVADMPDPAARARAAASLEDFTARVRREGS